MYFPVFPCDIQSTPVSGGGFIKLHLLLQANIFSINNSMSRSSDNSGTGSSGGSGGSSSRSNSSVSTIVVVCGGVTSVLTVGRPLAKSVRSLPSLAGDFKADIFDVLSARICSLNKSM